MIAPSIHTQRYLSPCGTLLLASYQDQLYLCDWEQSAKFQHHKMQLLQALQVPFDDTPSPVTAEAAAQLDAYFAHRLTAFSLPLSPLGTPFQRQVWESLRQIPYGQTITYGHLANRIGHPRSARPVGSAVGNNPLSLFLPCHRVVGATATQGGYAGGIAAKRYLLTWESTR